MNIKRLLIRYRATKLGKAYVKANGTNTPQSHRQLIRILRIAKGYTPFERSLPELNQYPLEAANYLEVWYLITGKPIKESPMYLVARISWALGALKK